MTKALDVAKEAGKYAVAAGGGAGLGAAVSGVIGGLGVAIGGTAVGVTMAPMIAIGAGLSLSGYGLYRLGNSVGKKNR